MICSLGLKTSYMTASETKICTSCNKTITVWDTPGGQFNWNQHLESKGHKERVAAEGQVDEPRSIAEFFNPQGEVGDQEGGHDRNDYPGTVAEVNQELDGECLGVDLGGDGAQSLR